MNGAKTILLVEDDEIDIKSVKRAFADLKITNPLAIKNNGEEALEYLKKGKKGSPGLILLDLKMPRMNGLEFLKIVKNVDKLRIIPIIVLTTSNEDKDKTESFNLGVSGYMIKPVNYRDFVEVIKTIKTYWTLSESP